MSAPLITLAAIAALAFIYVLVPIVGEVYFRFRARRTVYCLETGLAAQVEIDARHAAFTAVPGPPELRVAGCSLWPGRRGCERRCLAAVAAH
jgi:hypothetical protein